MAKGDKKRKHCGFKSNNKCHKQRKSNNDTYTVAERTYSRLNDEEFQNVTQSENGELYVLNPDETKVEDTCYLRPAKSAQLPHEDYYAQYESETKVSKDENVYAFLHLDKTTTLWNEAFKQHISENSNCDGELVWDMSKTVKWGMCRSMALKCTTCHFTSKRHKLYHEVETKSQGRKAGAPNKAVQVVLSRQGVGPSALTDIVHSMHMPAPSLSGLYKAGHKVSEEIVEENEKDMKDKIEQVKELNEKLGRPKNVIDAQSDGTYNNRLNSGVGKAPGQPATQATYLTAEDVSSRKFIIHIGTHNKLCRSCPDGQHGGPSCTQTWPEDEPIGNEGQFILNMIQDLNEQDTFINILTLDGDSTAMREAENAVQSNPDIKIKCQRCTKHLGQRMRMAVKNAIFSNNMFPSNTKQKRAYMQSRFALDIIARSQAEAKCMSEAFKGDPESLRSRATYMCDTIIKCYQGDCSECHKYSFCCLPQQPWNRPFLSTLKVDKAFISPNTEDVCKLRECLDKRFSRSNILKCYMNRNQNKCEGCNRAIIKAIPKHLTFSRWYPGRVSAAVHSVNNYPGVSLLKLCKAMKVPLPHALLHQLKQKDRAYIRRRSDKLSKAYRGKLALKRYNKFKTYDEIRDEKYYSQSIVDKEPMPSTSRTPARKVSGKSSHADHTYHSH